MTPPAFEEAIQAAAQAMRAARSIVALTGAGISTPSGIPDFRSTGSGLWTRDDPMKVSSLSSFQQHPERFFNWLRPLVRQIMAAEPNPAHQALAALEASGWLQGVITQNIDMLHQRAGSCKVIEMHGSLRQAVCTHCRKTQPLEVYGPLLLEQEEIPRCPDCGWILKPDIVLFGEVLPIQAMEAAQTLCENADLILVAGTALEVAPVNQLPFVALEKGATLIINTLSSTPLDGFADILIPYDVARTLPTLGQALSRS